jgi:hypothetical protein
MIEGPMRLLVFLLVLLASTAAAAAPQVVTVKQDDEGAKLVVDGHDLMVKGVVWGYNPIGTNYSYSLWKKPTWFIQKVLDQQMPLLRRAGINAIRPFDVPPPEWVRYIYEHYGIYTAISHMMARYGIEKNGVWIAHVDYSDPAMRAFILADLKQTVQKYVGTPGVLMWLLGNENNYGLTWTSFVAEDLPTSEQRDNARATFLYSLMSEAAQQIKLLDQSHPVALVNGDLGYIDIIAKNKKGLDIFGTNQYRGRSVGKMYADVKQKLGLPVLYTEFGSDCFNTKTGREDTVSAASFLHSQWQEVYEQSYGKGGEGTALGGFMFEWTDTWWKIGQDYNLDVHDTTATWTHEAYYDYVKGEKNMNEEWWGITALTPSDESGYYEPRPRTAYYVVADILPLDPYAEGTTLEKIRAHFAAIHPQDYESRYQAGQLLELSSSVRISNLMLKLEMTSSRGSLGSTRGQDWKIDHTESAYTDVTLQPSSKLYARLSMNFVANVAQNRLDPIFYENPTYYPPGAVAGQPRQTLTHPVSIYQGEIKADHRWFELDAFYRTPRSGWDYEGDFFHLYPDTHYGENVDIYRADAPFGTVVSAKGALEGFKLAFGPQIFWGANPTIIAKYRREIGPFTWTAMHQEDLISAQAASTNVATSAITPEPVSRKSVLAVEMDSGPVHVQVGGLFAGAQRVGREYTRTTTSSGPGYLGSGYDVLVDKVQWKDTFGGKAKIVYAGNQVNAYAQGAVKGLVADSGPDTSFTITGWSLKESGRGNQASALAGVSLGAGSFQVAPNFLYQRPFVGPNPRIDGVYDSATGVYSTPVRPRNILDDPFAVLDNRETAATELLLVYDPTPATQFFNWDRINREDAPFAASLDFVYRHQPTSRDSRIGVLDTGVRVPFGAAPPAHDVWDVTANWSSLALYPVVLHGQLYGGQDQARGPDPRLVTRYGGGLRLGYLDFLLSTRLLFNDWGPYDYYRDWNLTYPFQWYGDLSFGLMPATIGFPQTRFGVRGQYRILNQYSDGWPDKLNPGGHGREMEVTTYVQATL